MRCCFGWEWAPAVLLSDTCKQLVVFRRPDLEPLGGLELCGHSRAIVWGSELGVCKWGTGSAAGGTLGTGHPESGWAGETGCPATGIVRLSWSRDLQLSAGRFGRREKGGGGRKKAEYSMKCCCSERGKDSISQGYCGVHDRRIVKPCITMTKHKY